MFGTERKYNAFKFNNGEFVLCVNEGDCNYVVRAVRDTAHCDTKTQSVRNQIGTGLLTGETGILCGVLENLYGTYARVLRTDGEIVDVSFSDLSYIVDNRCEYVQFANGKCAWVHKRDYDTYREIPVTVHKRTTDYSGRINPATLDAVIHENTRGTISDLATLPRKILPGEKKADPTVVMLKMNKEYDDFFHSTIVNSEDLDIPDDFVVEYDSDACSEDEVAKTLEAIIDSAADERTTNNVMRHEYRVLSDVEKEQMKAIKNEGLELFEYIDSIGDSRELSLAKTKVEEAVMWAVKHITG